MPIPTFKLHLVAITISTMLDYLVKKIPVSAHQTVEICFSDIT